MKVVLSRDENAFRSVQNQVIRLASKIKIKINARCFIATRGKF